MKTSCTIFGNGNIDKLPDYDFEHSFAINAATQKYRTKFAFSGHDNWITKIVADHSHCLITPIPTFEGKYPSVDCFDYILHEQEYSRGDYDDDFVRYYFQRAIKKADIPYPNRFTALHLVIWYAILNNYTEIDLYGCRHDYDKIESECEYNKAIAPEMRKFTAAMIRIAPEFGIKINWH
jgi:hypothetical protein